MQIDCALYEVTPADGGLTLIGSLGLPPADCTGFDSGAAFYEFNQDVLWAVRSDGAIYQIDPATGQAVFQAFVEDNGVRVPGPLEGLDIPQLR